MTDYSYTPNEEIARWATEVYVKTHPGLGWWVAFTNPTAGPWKKIVALSELGVFTEIYRFGQTEERPDLILVNDRLESILIIEAKDRYDKLNNPTQMSKSVRVINNITDILSDPINTIWRSRSDYKFIPSFLWMCAKVEDIAKECTAIQTIYSEISEKEEDLLNIVLYSDSNNNLINSFNYKGDTYTDLDIDF